jgi:hypothetical protein
VSEDHKEQWREEQQLVWQTDCPVVGGHEAPARPAIASRSVLPLCRIDMVMIANSSGAIVPIA